jgi:hypothetical protein
VHNLTKFQRLLEKVIPELISPGIEMPLFEFIYQDKKMDVGFLVVYIAAAEGLPIHARISKEISDFFIRIGWSFMPMDYSMIADRFGRRPQPKLEFVIWTRPENNIMAFEYGLRNIGRGLATHAHLMVSGIPAYTDLIYGQRNDSLKQPEGDTSFLALSIPPNSSIPPSMTWQLGQIYTPMQRFRDVSYPLEIKCQAFADGYAGSGSLFLTDDCLKKKMYYTSDTTKSTTP